MRLIYALCFAVSALAQPVLVAAQAGASSQSTQLAPMPRSTTTYSLSNALAGAAGAAALNLSVSTTRPQVQPISLGFTVNWTQADASGTAVAAGPALTGTGKTLNCASVPTGLSCTIGGGATVIPNGVAAIVNTTVNKTTAFSLTATSALNKFSAPLLTANAGGGTITIPVQLASIACASPQIEPGEDVICTATLNQAAPVTGTTVQISSSAPTVVALVDATGAALTSISIPAASTSGTFIARGL